MKTVGKIHPTGFNVNLKYKYVTEKDVIHAVRDAMVEQGLIIFPTSTRCVRYQENVRINRFDIEVTYRVQHVSNEHIDVTVVVGSSDRNDKGSQKAMVTALKYALKQLFLLTEEESRPQTATPEQTEQFEAWCQRNGGFERILQYCVMNDYGDPLSWARDKQIRFQRAVNDGRIQLEYTDED